MWEDEHSPSGSPCVTSTTGAWIEGKFKSGTRAGFSTWKRIYSAVVFFPARGSWRCLLTWKASSLPWVSTQYQKPGADWRIHPRTAWPSGKHSHPSSAPVWFSELRLTGTLKIVLCWVHPAVTVHTTTSLIWVSSVCCFKGKNHVRVIAGIEFRFSWSCCLILAKIPDVSVSVHPLKNEKGFPQWLVRI